ncbi:YkwA (plasmid) [Corynebacterium jeikeium K411]|uniref:YkwA n=1 Tax=Corynebacterium jeikeium (strain K411) TaxID=306537 RepID=Q93MJ6_CORJK|nr:hypothetical protein [Corynebacterium jeikeium]AAK94051.1 YkwA [Corynebacterium jeikeium K411]
MTYDYWRPSQEQRDKVNEVASDRRPELLEESYREALAWLEDVDEFSPTPDPAMATILKRALSRVQFYNQTVPDVDLPSPQWTPVDDLVLNGGVAKEWIASLHTVHNIPTANSRDARQVRALLHALGHDVPSFLREQYQVASQGEAGVYCMVPDDRANVLAVRPTSCRYLDTTGASVETHRDPSRGGNLAVFLRLNAGVLTLLPHESRHSGVQFGYSGTGPRNLANDIVNAYPAASTLTDNQRDSETDRVFQEISVDGLTALMIHL